MFNKQNAARYGQKGGMTTYARYGREHMAEIGRKGFEKTTLLHFHGRREWHINWLVQKGIFTYWLQTGIPMRYGVDGKPIYRDVDHPSRTIPF